MKQLLQASNLAPSQLLLHILICCNLPQTNFCLKAVTKFNRYQGLDYSAKLYANSSSTEHTRHAEFLNYFLAEESWINMGWWQSKQHDIIFFNIRGMAKPYPKYSGWCFVDCCTNCGRSSNSSCPLQVFNPSVSLTCINLFNVVTGGNYHDDFLFLACVDLAPMPFEYLLQTHISVGLGEIPRDQVY